MDRIRESPCRPQIVGKTEAFSGVLRAWPTREHKLTLHVAIAVLLAMVAGSGEYGVLYTDVVWTAEFA